MTLSGGDKAGQMAKADFDPAGANNAIRFTASDDDVDKNGIKIVFTDTIRQVVVATDQKDSSGNNFFMSSNFSYHSYPWWFFLED